MRNYFKSSVFVIILLALGGCPNGNRFSDIPFLEFRDYRLYQEERAPGIFADMIEVQVYFTDGDGDVGLDETDDQPPFCDTCEFGQNFLVDIYSFNGGPIDTFTNNFRIKNLTPSGQNKTLEGIIKNQIDITSRQSDTIQLQFQLLDRALNASAPVTSPKIHVSLP